MNSLSGLNFAYLICYQLAILVLTLTLKTPVLTQDFPTATEQRPEEFQC